MFVYIFNLVCQRLLYFALHISGTNSFPKPLPPDEERRCFELMQNGDESARNKLIEHNLRLVAHVIKKYYSISNDQDDLISVGTIGLIKAVSSFGIDRGTKFATYAARCIENEILMQFRLQKKSAQDVFIADPLDTDKEGNCITLLDIVPDEQNVADNVDLILESEKLYNLIDSFLDVREREILYLRYGLRGLSPLTQKQVADKMGISRSYVSRLEKKSLEKLRKHF